MTSSLLADRLIFEFDENGQAVRAWLEKTSTPVPVEPPLLKLTQEQGAVLITIDPQPVPVDIWVRSSQDSVLLGTIQPGDTTLRFTGKGPVKYEAYWRLWFWAVVGDKVGPESAIQLPPAVELPQSQIEVPKVPDNAIVADAPHKIKPALDRNAKDGTPVVIRGTYRVEDLPDRQIFLSKHNRGVWIEGVKLTGTGKGTKWLNYALIYCESGAKDIFVYNGAFENVKTDLVFGGYNPNNWLFVGNTVKEAYQAIHVFLGAGEQKLVIDGNVLHAYKRTIEIQSNGFSDSNQFKTSGVVITNNEVKSYIGGEMVMSLACASAYDMKIIGNRLWQPKKGSPEDADKGHGGIGYGIEAFAGYYGGNRIENSTKGIVLQGKGAPFGCYIAASNVFINTGTDISFQNGGEYNKAHVIEARQ